MANHVVTQESFDRMKTLRYRQGDIIMTSNKKIFLVLKEMRVNLRVLGTDGLQYTARRLGAQPAPVGTTWEDEAGDEVGADEVGNAFPGTVVRFKNPADHRQKGRFVITGGDSLTGFRLHSLGGSSKYYSGVMGISLVLAEKY